MKIQYRNMKNLKYLVGIILLLLKSNLSAQLTLNDTKKMEPISKATEPWDTATKLNYRFSIGGNMFSPFDKKIPVYPSGYSYDFVQNDTRITSIMHNSQGFIIRNGISLDIKNNPISPNIDIAYAHGNFNMIGYNEVGSVISHSWFRNINLITVGAGFDISGKYVNVGIQYRFGYCAGGDHNDKLPFDPLVVKDNKLNLLTNIYHGLDFSLGAQYRNFCFKFSRVIPLTDPIYFGNGISSGLLTTSVELGYMIKI